MAKKTKIIPSSVTAAILEAYDSGTTLPATIYSKLMLYFPMLSIATINSVLDNHRKKKSPAPPAPKKEKPKSPIEQLEEYLEERCRHCPYFPGPAQNCVLPESLCIYPDQKQQAERLKQMREEVREKEQIRREERKKADAEYKKNRKALMEAFERNKVDAFMDAEEELDLMLDEEEEENKFDIRDYIGMNLPSEEELHKRLEEME